MALTTNVLPMAKDNQPFEKAAELARAGVPFVQVLLAEIQGSAPQEPGSRMLVTTEGRVLGTVGGGRIEQKAICYAREMLAGTPDRPVPLIVRWNLQTDVGMTCGGTVTICFEPVNLAIWRIAVFGAGHVANALVRLLSQIDCQITCIDPRREWLDRLPVASTLTAVQQEHMPDYVALLPDDTYVICLTMGHRTDRPILEAIFHQDRPFPYIGAIGSRAKRQVLERELTANGVPPDRLTRLYCPIGLELGSNQPGEIAVSIAAQLIQERRRR